jgi:multiple sugar transport system substrate-binding protein
MRKMKVLSLLLVAIMLVLAACGGGKNSNNQSSGGTNTGSQTENTGGSDSGSDNGSDSGSNSGSEQAEEPAPIDLGGRTIRVAAWWDPKPAGETIDEQARLDKIAELEQKYNFKFEWINVPFEEYMDKLTTSTLAGEPFADIARMEVKRAIPIIKQGLVLPLSEFTTATDDINNEQRLMTKLTPIGGEEYSFVEPGLKIIGVYYNRDLVKRLGVKDPQDLYESGQWNWESFLQLAKDATRDTDNDGAFDTFGYSGWAADAGRQFGVSNGAMFVNEDLTLGMTDPRMIEALEFVNRLYNVENVVKVKTGNKMDWNETNTFKDGDVLMSINYDWNMGDLTFEVGIVPNPAGPQFDGSTFANTDQNAWFILKGVQDPQIVYSIFEQSFDIESTAEYVGQDWLESRFKTERDIQFALNHVNGTGRLALEEGVPDFPFYAIMDEIIMQNQSVSATIEKHLPTAESALEKVR